jgi:hypothetical protein
VDLTPSEQQQFILHAVRKLLDQRGGYKRTMELLSEAAYDAGLDGELDAAGFGDVALGGETGPLEAAQIAHEIALGGGTVSYGARSLVAAMVLGELPEGPVALARNPANAALRFGGHARTVLIDAGEEALRLSVGSDDWEFVDNGRAGYPLGRLLPGRLDRAESLGAGSGERLRSWWRVALAIETAGTMKGAVDTTVAYVKDRVQFGRPIGSFQAVQHRLAHCTVLIEGARWLALEAAFKGAPADRAATAAGHATGAANQVFRESHQLHGAMGFTREHHLHVWTMRLPALLQELGGPSAHRRFLARTKFGGASA